MNKQPGLQEALQGHLVPLCAQRRADFEVRPRQPCHESFAAENELELNTGACCIVTQSKILSAVPSPMKCEKHRVDSLQGDAEITGALRPSAALLGGDTLCLS